MQPDTGATATTATAAAATPSHRPSLLRAVRHHALVVVAFLALGIVGGYLLSATQPVVYSSTAHVLVNPTIGNPFAPAPSSVRQDEMTSLETEAQVARSAEVLTGVAEENPPLTMRDVQRRATINLPPNTQVLEMTYTARDADLAQQVADSWAVAYLANRDRRSAEVNAERVERVEAQTQTVVENLRAAAAATQKGTDAERFFQSQLASALRNELVSLRAQRSYLDNSEAPAGSIISPASNPAKAGSLTPLLMLVGVSLAGLLLGCLVAAVLEHLRGAVRSASEVEDAGIPVLASAPSHRWAARLRRTTHRVAPDAAVRRLRARILDLDPTPEIIAVTPAGDGGPDTAVCEAVAESFAKAGHRVVLVRADGPTAAHGLEVEGRGLAQALLHERLNVLEMLHPSVEPLLCLLPWGSDEQSSDLLDADRLRTVLKPLVDAGHFVVLQSPGIDSAEGEAVVGAADLGLVVVTTGRTRTRAVAQVTARTGPKDTPLAALVLDRHSHAGLSRHAGAHVAVDADEKDAVEHDPATKARR